MVADSVQVILLFGLMGLVTNYIAWRKGFYQFPIVEPPPIALKHVISVFCIYLAAVQLLAPYLSQLLLNLSAQQPPSFEMAMTVQFVIILVMVLSLYLYCHYQGKGVFAKIWKNPFKPYTTPLQDLGVGIITWFMAFPVVAIVGQICDLVLFLIYNLETYEQVAVKYLKSTRESPIQLVLALISILVIAPILEEFLFRGSLQTYLKRWFGAKAAILLAGFCFACFHFSTSQGLGNISLLTSLFVFACFLGFVYERQGSLYASIGLHMTFNLASTLRILFLPE